MSASKSTHALKLSDIIPQNPILIIKAPEELRSDHVRIHAVASRLAASASSTAFRIRKGSIRVL